MPMSTACCRNRVSLLSRLHSHRSTLPSVRDHSNDFEDARDPNTFSTRARKLSSTDSEDAIEIEGEGDFLRGCRLVCSFGLLGFFLMGLVTVVGVWVVITVAGQWVSGSDHGRWVMGIWR